MRGLPTQNASEKTLLIRARAGDEFAFAALVAPLRDRIYWRAVKAVSDLDEAEDVTQETLLRAFTRLETFRGESRFSSWLFQVGTNCIRMHLRSRRRRRTLPLQNHTPELQRRVEDAGQLPHLPDAVVLHEELTHAIDVAIDALPPQYGTILRLWVEEGLDLKGIQARSGLSIAAIKSRLHRARRKVRASIEDRHGEGTLLAA